MEMATLGFFAKVEHLRKTTNLRYLFTYWTQSSVCVGVCVCTCV